jgi:hypothetical protein
VYERPIRSRYVDPLEVVWLATARRLGLHVRRNAAIFSATDGTGLLELGPKDTLDPDDTTAQMILHEICHWIVNGVETFHERDWGFDLDGPSDPREHAGLRVQAALADPYGLRQVLAPTSPVREYYDTLPADPLAPMDGSPFETEVVGLARTGFGRAGGEPWAGPLRDALTATRRLRDVVTPFLSDYQTDIPDDSLPSLWSR